MALVLGNQTNSNLNPASSTQTLAHNQNTGTGRLLLVTIAMSNTVTVTGMTYAGTPMTQIQQTTSTTYSSRYASFYLLNPTTGSNNIVVSFSGNQWNTTAIFARSYTGAGGIGSFGYNDASSTPHSRTLSISAGSSIFAMGNSSSAQNFGYVIDGVTQSNVGNGFNINNIVEAAYSSPIATGGSKTVNTVTDFGTITNYRIEVKESTPPPTLSRTPTSLSGFTYQEGSGPSSEQTFTVSGDYLTSNVTVAAPTNYEVSTTSGSGFGASVVLTQSGGNVVGEPKTVYVRLKSGLSVGTYNGNVTISSTGATSLTVALSGSVTAVPVLVVVPSTLTGFTYQEGSGPSAEQSVSVAGANLTNNCTISAPTNYEISKTSGSGFTTSIVETSDFSYTLYVRLKAGLSAGAYNGEIINMTSTGASSKTITLDGDVTSVSGGDSGDYFFMF